MLGGRRHRVAHPNLRDDFLNIAIISEINRLIGDTGYHFAVCDDLGMPNWVVALTRGEEKRLHHERGWSFLTLTPVFGCGWTAPSRCRSLGSGSPEVRVG